MLSYFHTLISTWKIVVFQAPKLRKAPGRRNFTSFLYRTISSSVACSDLRLSHMEADDTQQKDASPSKHLLRSRCAAHRAREWGGWQGRQRALPSPLDQPRHDGKRGLRLLSPFSISYKTWCLDIPGKSLSQLSANITVHIFCSWITSCSCPLINWSCDFWRSRSFLTPLWKWAAPQAAHTDVPQHTSPADLCGDTDLIGTTHIPRQSTCGTLHTGRTDQSRT